MVNNLTNYYFYLNKIKRLGIDHIQNMAKLYAYYITNTKAELKYVYQGLSKEKFYEEVEKNLSEYLAEDDIAEVEEDYDCDDDEDEYEDEDEDENSTNNNNNRIDEYLNLASEELRRLLEVQVVEVRIEKQPVDHGEKDFDINALLQEQFSDN